MQTRLKKSFLFLFLLILSILLSPVIEEQTLFLNTLIILTSLCLVWEFYHIWQWYRLFHKISQVSEGSRRLFTFTEETDDLRRLAKRLKNLEKDLVLSDQDSQDKDLSFKAFLEHISMGIFVVSPTKRIELQSRSLGNFFPRLDPKSFKTLADLRRSDITVLVNRVFEEGQVIKKELVGLSDTDLILEVTVVPIRNHQGHFHDVMVFLYDLTPIRLYEQQNMDFVANASHELRTPVTSIKGFAETLIEMPSDEDEAVRQEFLSIIQKESNRLEHIVNHMLTLSKLNQNKPQLSSFDLVAFLKEVTQGLSPKMAEKGLDFQLELPDKLIYETDHYMLSQIIINLLTNAIRYTDQGGQVRISLLEKDKSLEISVADTGIGIGPYQLERIFERFYRINKGRSRQTGGTGLGLSIVKELSEALGGKISVSSQVGQGSTFTLSLPITIGMRR
uniref:two-component system histidine kinase PnpS n=1 Tax=Streptococcus pluranimalium TaxID=82348 RepID=UPI003F6907F6